MPPTPEPAAADDDAPHGLDVSHANPPRMSHGPTELREGIAHTRLDPHGEGRFQALRRELELASFGLNLLRLRPGQRSRIHVHERQEEVFVVQEGTLTLVAEGEEHAFATGDVVRVAPGTRRQLVNRHPELLVLLAIGGSGPHEGRDATAYTSWDAGEQGKSPTDVPYPPDLEL
jgi:uncharacterized cupin superfamily protein